MKISKILGLSGLGLSLVAGLFVYQTSAADIATDKPDYLYKIVAQSPDPTINPHDPGWLRVTLKNMGDMSWPTESLRLGSMFFDGGADRESQLATSEWLNSNRVAPDTDQHQTEVRPQGRISFNVPIQAPAKVGVYLESFRLVLDGTGWVDGPLIEWQVQVGHSEDIRYQSTDAKQITISLHDQRLWAIENGVIILNTSISSGAAGYDTPKGTFTIMNHIDTAYSAPYQLYMDNWMAITSPTTGYRGYGLHSLPYWNFSGRGWAEGEVRNGRLYTQGKLYEDFTHLGEKRSHGCVRLGINAAKSLSDWAENGTTVEII